MPDSVLDPDQRSLVEKYLTGPTEVGGQVLGGLGGSALNGLWGLGKGIYEGGRSALNGHGLRASIGEAADAAAQGVTDASEYTSMPEMSDAGIHTIQRDVAPFVHDVSNSAVIPEGGLFHRRSVGDAAQYLGDKYGETLGAAAALAGRVAPEAGGVVGAIGSAAPQEFLRPLGMAGKVFARGAEGAQEAAAVEHAAPALLEAPRPSHSISVERARDVGHPDIGIAGYHPDATILSSYAPDTGHLSGRLVMEPEGRMMRQRDTDVDDNYQRQGVGTNLLKTAIDTAHHANLDFGSDTKLSPGMVATFHKLETMGYPVAHNPTNVVTSDGFLTGMNKKPAIMVARPTRAGDALDTDGLQAHVVPHEHGAGLLINGDLASTHATADEAQIYADMINSRKFAEGGKVGASLGTLKRLISQYSPEAGKLHFAHYSNLSDPQVTLDPKFYGTGIKGAEATRGGIKTTSLYPSHVTTPEHGLESKTRYHVEVPENRLYNASTDPHGIVQKSSSPASFSLGDNGEMVPVGEPQFDMNDFEQNVKDAGFLGYHTPGADGIMRGQARLFEPHPAVRADMIDALHADPLHGLPAVEGYDAGPHPPIRAVAEQYKQAAGIEAPHARKFVKQDPATAQRVAQAYDAMQHAPDDPKVKASYDAMIAETLAQYQHIKGTGLHVEFIPPGAPDPYAASPREATKDIRDNNHFWVYPTSSGFGSGEDLKGNPLLHDVGESISEQPATANDIFRVVHDYFGHAKEGLGFRADGEENAWRQHASMYSDLARPAMTTETRGQNSWVNHGPHGETNRTASAKDTHYAPQKIGLLPDEFNAVTPDDAPEPAGYADGGRVGEVVGPLARLMAKYAPEASHEVAPAAYREYAHASSGIGQPGDLRARYIAAQQAGVSPKLLAQGKDIRGSDFLTPEEFSGIAARKPNIGRFNEILGILPKAKEVASVAKAGEPKRGWYRASAQAIQDVFGPEDAPRFAGLLAALSPQVSVQSNLTNALRTWTNWDAAGRPTDPGVIHYIMGQSVLGDKGENSVLGAWKNNAVTALTHPEPNTMELSGHKVNSFMGNLLNNTQAVTNDAWMANYGFGNADKLRAKGVINDKQDPQYLFRSPAGYGAMASRVREAADLNGTNPENVQESVWSVAKPLYELGHTGNATRNFYLDALRETHPELADALQTPPRSAEKVLEMGALTPRVINSTPDFGSLLKTPEYQQHVDLSKYGDAISGLPAPIWNDPLPMSAEDETHLQAAARRLDSLGAVRDK